ncbi:indolepyruvate oxidoreductase subunit beta [Desulfovibrio sp. OttesenSCG-928-A18]|nr:indolepyruvate oxidoreductase subunit beta [Desulfovibrio sp. OttesenSCG-928-A18]
MSARLRIYLTGVGGQGTLTATTLLSRTLLDQGLDVVSGEIHGMAQRGGVVESTILVGGWRSPSIQHGEADVILGFEALETLRGLPYLAPGGAVFSSTDFVPPPGVNMGRESLPPIRDIEEHTAQLTRKSCFLPLQELGRQAGSVQSGNTALLGAFCASGLLPVGVDALAKGIRSYLPPKIVDVNLRALELGASAIGQCI